VFCIGCLCTDAVEGVGKGRRICYGHDIRLPAFPFHSQDLTLDRRIIRYIISVNGRYTKLYRGDNMVSGRFISYLRVSTDKQGKSKLGLEAQRREIEQYTNSNDWTVLHEFVEVESGKNDERTQLRLALEACKRTGSKLLVAKLDRLSRDVAFIANLMKSKAEFVACDFPEANSFSIHILSAMAEYERELISKRTKDALAAARARGKKLGSPQNLTEEAANKGRVVGLEVRQAKADEYAQRIYFIIRGYQDEGMSLNAIARKLMQDRELTPRGKETWTPTTVKNVLNRVNRGERI
jgi:DNA invertase Pin-like site-specific DNA recombinase